MRTKPRRPQYYAFYLTSQVARKLEAHYNRVLAPLGLTAKQMMALGVLWFEEGLSLGVFAERLGVGKAAAVTMIDRLEAMGMVARRPHPGDARLNVLELSEEAKRLAPEVGREIARLEKSLESKVGPDRMRAVFEGLTEVLETDL